MELSSLSSVQELLPSIRARRAEIESLRRLPADLATDLRRTGIFALGVPRAIGGAEGTPLDLMRVIEDVATADGSAGWCTMTGIANNVSAGYMSEDGAREVFADPAMPTAGIAGPGGTAGPEPGGMRISGRWPFASGVTHCDWIWVGCIVTEDGRPRMTPHGPEIVHACLRVADGTVHDTWHVSGLCGSGSHDFSAADVFVPANRIFLLLDPRDHRPEPLYQMPPLTLFIFQLASVSLGIARSALNELTEVARSKVPTLYTQVLADKPVVQVELARAEAALRSARSFLCNTAREMWDAVSDGRTPSPQDLAHGRLAAIHAVETSAAVARTANTLAGGSAIYLSSSLQRHARDAEAITHHFTVAPHVWEEAGRVLLGRDPLTPVF